MATRKSSRKSTVARTDAAAHARAAETATDESIAEQSSSSFPIVAIGASAGGLEAFTELLKNLPDEPDAAFVFVSHLDPHHVSALPEIFGRETAMQVSEVRDRMSVEPNNLYVMPPNMEMTIYRGVLRLTPAGDQRPHMPIDAFMRSLAEDQGGRAIAVVLSGTASDGALGAKAVKSEGGIAFAQDESARFDGMPRSAVALGSIDFVLPPADIARELVRIAHHSYVSGSHTDGGRVSQSALTTIHAVLRGAHDIDFAQYKPATIERRIRRRMALRRVDTPAEYVELLRQNPAEVELLYADILIGVTGFFRDAAVFNALRKDILPKILAERGNNDPIRVWVPGCASGEEVYSIAILILETVAERGVAECPMQIFGTDVSESAIERARAGIYPENIESEVAPERLRRYFSKSDGVYRVSKLVRDCCVFARQNLTKDPPFSKLDLISCRNVMIYLGSALQRQVMSIFHFALRAHGYLLLGSSETIGNFGDLFAIMDRKHKIYKKKPGAARIPLVFDPSVLPAPVRRGHSEEDVLPGMNLFREADRIALSRYAPSGVLVNESGEILQFRGRTSRFLEPAPGAANFNVLTMAREGLLAELRTAMQDAKKSDEPVRREGIRLSSNGSSLLVNLEVLPIVTPARERYQLIIFEEGSIAVEAKKRPKKSAKVEESDSKQVVRLKRELEATRDYLQSIIEEQETMNEELRSANEEIQSSNEELQSTNEEMETAKEELQSSNEELTTLNEELEMRNRELAEANDDLINLLASVDIPIVMLDIGLRIRRFNPGAQRILGVLPADIGRQLGDLKTSLPASDLDQRIRTVIDTLVTHEEEVRDRTGRLFSLRIRPYKTADNRIEGVVIALVDIDQIRRAPGG